MPRIVHLSTVHHDWDNRIVNKECRALAQAGLDTHLVISAPTDRVTEGVQVHAIRKRGRRSRLVASQLEAWRWLRRLGPELLHIHDPELIPLAMAWRARHPGCAIVYDAHEDLVKQISTKPWARGPRGWLVRPLAKALVGMADRHFDGIVTVTEGIAEGFRPERKGRPRPVVVVQNLPWSTDFSPVDVARAERVAVYTGDLTRERGFAEMVDAAERAQARLVLAGRPLVDDPRLTVAGEDPVVDYRGLVQPTQLPEVISQGRVGLIFLKRLPNYENSLPTKVFEYMASGVPFLATDFPAWQALFGDYEAGVFVDTDDADAVAAALEQLMDDPERCAELGRNGRRAVEERFSFENEADKLVELVGRLAS